jgi:hypothetical protein
MLQLCVAEAGCVCHHGGCTHISHVHLASSHAAWGGAASLPVHRRDG